MIHANDNCIEDAGCHTIAMDTECYTIAEGETAYYCPNCRSQLFGFRLTEACVVEIVCASCARIAAIEDVYGDPL